jgi:phage gp36-like protein
MLAEVQDLLDRWDRRLIAQLARDDGQPEQNLESNRRILAALKGAEGQVRSAILKGRRYTLEELENLEPEDLAFLKDIICSLAMLRLAACRVNTLGSQLYESLREQTTEILKQLESGELIFATKAAQDAGLPRTEGVSLVDVYRQNLLVDRCVRYYPPRIEGHVLGG